MNTATTRHVIIFPLLAILLAVAGVRAADASPAETIPQSTEKGNIANLINAGKISADISGQSISNISATLKNTTPQPLEVLIPAGTYFVCSNKDAQNMLSTQDVRITLNQDPATSTTSISIPAACANRSKDTPEANDKFTIGTPPNAAELAKLAPALNTTAISQPIKQAAVWIVTDDADYNDLGKLVTKTSTFGASPLTDTTTRAIMQPEATAAMRLCADAGIDIKTKAIWKNAREIHARLPDGELRDWLKTFGGLTTPTHPQVIANLLISPDGKRLLTADGDDNAALWSLPDGKRIKTLELGLGYRHAVISPDGNCLITMTGAEYNLSDGTPVPTHADENPDGPRRININGPTALSPDGSLLASIAHSYETSTDLIKVFHLPDGALLATLDPGATNAFPISISPDGKQLAAPGAGGLKFWSLPDGKLLKTLKDERNSLISRDWKWRLSFHREQTPLDPRRPYGLQNTRLTIAIHSPATEEARAGTLAEYPGTMDNRATTITPDGKHLLLVTLGGTVRLLGIPDGALALTVENVEDSILSPDGQLLVTLQNNTLTARRLPDGKILGAFNLTGASRYPLRTAIISPDNSLLVVDASDINDPAIIEIWSLPDGKLLKTLEGE